MVSNRNKNPFDLLSGIQKVEAPPFLFTRIEERIESKNFQNTSPKIVWTFGLSFVLVLILNITVITKNANQNNQNNNLIENMGLQPDNNIYK